MDAAADLALGEQAEEALHLVDPGGRGRGEVDVPTRALGEPVADSLGLVGAGIVDDEMDVEIVRNPCLDGIEELARTSLARNRQESDRLPKLERASTHLSQVTSRADAQRYQTNILGAVCSLRARQAATRWSPFFTARAPRLDSATTSFSVC